MHAQLPGSSAHIVAFDDTSNIRRRFAQHQVEPPRHRKRPAWKGNIEQRETPQ
jgi:hypothetical protein